MTTLLNRTLKNRYRVEAFLGRGGMAEVYQVFDLERGVPLAMKVLREDLAEDRVFLRRFEREARSLSRLQHPNIVRFYGLEQEGRLAFILMEFIQGSTLRGIVFDQHGPFEVPQILEVLRPVCSALHYAHQMGIVHCDIKSANIMVDTNGGVHLTDFGIARFSDAATATMVGMGTPGYMAPELVRGQDPDPRADIYALGVLLYELATGGERPFTGESARISGSTSERIRWEQINRAPTPPSAINPRVTAQLEAIILHCLQKEPDSRYGNALELLAVLEKLPATARPVRSLANLTAGPPMPAGEPLRAAGERLTPGDQMSRERTKVKPWLAFVSIGIILAAVIAAVTAGYFLSADKSPALGDGTAPSDLAFKAATEQTGAQVPLPGPQEDTQQPGSEKPSGIPISLENTGRLRQVDEFGGLLDPYAHWSLSPDARWLAVVNEDVVEVRPLGNTGEVLSIRPPLPIDQLAYSPDGAWLAGMSYGFPVYVWDARSGELVQHFMHENNTSAIEFSSDSRILYVVDLFGILYAREIRSGELIGRFEISGGLVTTAAFSPDRELVAVGLNGADLQIARVADGSMVRSIRVYDQSDFPLPMVSFLKFTPDGTHLAASDSRHPSLRFWEVASGELARGLPDGAEDYYCASFSRDGTLMVIGTRNGELLFWDTASGSLLESRQAYTKVISDLAFSTDGTRLVSVLADGSVGIWEIQ